MNSMTIYGAGGCGTNIISDFTKTIHPNHDNIDFVAIDSSDSNMKMLPHGVATELIGAGHGSGKVRRTNVSVINEHIQEYVENTFLSDINVIVFAASSGSGSVIGPLLMKEIAKRGKRIVCLVINDTIDYLGSVNTMNTWKTLNSLAQQNGIYIPTLTIDNAEVINRTKANEMACRKLGYLTRAVACNNIVEIDDNDKLNVLCPLLTCDADPGVYGWDILPFATVDQNFDGDYEAATKPDESGWPFITKYGFHEKECKTVHSMMYINFTETAIPHEGPHALSLYTGYFNPVKQYKYTDNLMLVVGYPLSQMMIEEIEAGVKRKKTISGNIGFSSTNVSKQDDVIDESGLII